MMGYVLLIRCMGNSGGVNSIKWYDGSGMFFAFKIMAIFAIILLQEE